MVQKNILIIDDEDYIREMIIDFLEIEDMKGIPVKSIADATEKLRMGQFDLILADINLKNENIQDLLNIMKRGKIDTPVILMTGDQNIDDILVNNNIVKDVLHKPFQYKIFFDKIKSCLER
ncbi:MAG: response regulator [Acidobacteriota bacterium]